MATQLDKILASKAMGVIQKKFGDAILRKASDFGVAKLNRIPSGIFALDYALGGGFPVGRINVLWGAKSAAKTTTFLKALANATKQCASCWKFAPCSCKAYREPAIAFLDVEGTLDIPWAARMGLHPDKYLLSIPEYAEQTLDIAEALLLTEGGCDILVIDSLAFLTPMKEIEKSVAEDTVGLQARQLGKGIRKFTSAVNKRRNLTGQGPTLFFTNQIRMKVGVMFGSPETTPGGLAPGYASTTETKMNTGKYEMDEVLGTPLTATFPFRVEKNKSAAAKMEGDFVLILADTDNRKVGDAYNEGEMIKRAEQFGLVSGAGSKWEAMGQHFKAKSLVEKELLENPEFYTKMHAAIMSLLTDG
jgi:recombination protein RecA